MHPTARLAFRRTLAPSVGAATGNGGLKAGVKRDPELIPLFAIMVGFIGMAGYFAGVKIMGMGSDGEQTSDRVMLPNLQNTGVRHKGQVGAGDREGAKEDYKGFESTHPADDRTRLRDVKSK